MPLLHLGPIVSICLNRKQGSNSSTRWKCNSTLLTWESGNNCCTFFSWCCGFYRMSSTPELINILWHSGRAPLYENCMAGVTDPDRLWGRGQRQLIVRTGIAEDLPTVPTVMLNYGQKIKNLNLQQKCTWSLNTNKQYTQSNPKRNSFPFQESVCKR